VLKKHNDFYHSAIKIGDEVIDISSGEIISYAEVLRSYGELHVSYKVDPDKIKPLFTALNGTFK